MTRSRITDLAPTLRQLIAEHDALLPTLVDGGGDLGRRHSAGHLRRFYSGSSA